MNNIFPDTLDELSYLMQNANVSDCLSQTWCYYNRYRTNANNNEAQMIEDRSVLLDKPTLLQSQLSGHPNNMISFLSTGVDAMLEWTQT